MKKLIALLLALCMVFTLAACGGSGSEETEGAQANNESESAQNNETEATQAGEPVVVTVWTMYAESDEPTATSSRYQTLVDEWNATHTDIQIELSNAKTYDNIITAISAGATPDIFQMYWQYAPSLAEIGAIMDLTDYVKNDAEFDYDDFLPSVWNLCSVGESIYSIPITASTTYILYNPKVLAENGWDHFPATMEEFEQCAMDCLKLNADGTIDVMGFDPIFPWQDDVLWPAAFGAEWLDANGDVAFNNDTMKETYAFQKRLIDAAGGYEQVAAWGTDYYSTRCTTTDPVLTGKAAMRFNGDSGLAGFQEAAIELGLTYGEDYAIAALPTSMLTAGVFEINAKSANPDAAWTVMAYLNSKESMAYLAEGGYNRGAFMPRVSALNALAEMDVTDAVKEACQLLQTEELVSFPMSPYVNEYLTAISTYMSEYLRGNIDIDEAVAGVQEEAQAACDSYK